MNHNRAKEVILQATLESIAERSISNTSMQVIAEKSGVKQPNLHYYFKTKKDLLVQLMDWMEKHYHDLTEQYVGTQTTFKGKMAGHFAQEQFIIEHEPAYTRVSFDLWGLGQTDPEINQCYARTYGVWRDWISETIGQYMPEISEEKQNLTAAMIVSMLMGAGLQYLSNPEAFNLERYIHYCLDAVMLILERESSLSSKCNE